MHNARVSLTRHGRVIHALFHARENVYQRVRLVLFRAPRCPPRAHRQTDTRARTHTHTHSHVDTMRNLRTPFSCAPGHNVQGAKRHTAYCHAAAAWATCQAVAVCRRGAPLVGLGVAPYGGGGVLCKVVADFRCGDECPYFRVVNLSPCTTKTFWQGGQRYCSPPQKADGLCEPVDPTPICRARSAVPCSAVQRQDGQHVRRLRFVGCDEIALECSS